MTEKSPDAHSRSVTRSDWNRSGAANIAGVTYQVGVTAWLLASGRAGTLRVTSVTPEGDEDVDCRLHDGTRLLVQTKDRAAGTGVLLPSEVLKIIHGAELALNRDSTATLVIVTNASLGGDIPFSGWTSHLDQILTAEGRSALNVDNLHRIRTVRMPWCIADEITDALVSIYRLPRSVAALACWSLLHDVMLVASDQRNRNRLNAISRSLADLDRLAQDVVASTNPEALDQAIRSGIVTFVSFKPDGIALERYLAGVNAQPGHVAADLDIRRPDELAAIVDGLHSDRYTLIVGPSGCGKSTLLWRAALDASALIRVVRIMRLVEADVPELLRWIHVQAPSDHARVLICADDLGRPGMEGWDSAARQLLEVPGVILLGAVRHEDFRISLTSGRGKVVEILLSEQLAVTLADALKVRNVTVRMTALEAFANSNGLLMEYLHLLTAGRRLRDVVTAQVDERLAPDRSIERDLLRYVSTAHVVGRSLSAEHLLSLLPGVDTASSLDRLNHEHLITTDRSSRWTGVHELRSMVICSRLHELPPPTEAMTLCRLISMLSPDEAAEVIVQSALLDRVSMESYPETVARRLARGGESAKSAKDLLVALGEADATAWARSCLRALQGTSNSVDPYAVLLMAWTKRFAGVDFSIPIPGISEISARLPSPPLSLRKDAVVMIGTPRIVELLLASSPSDAAGLLEAVRDCLTLQQIDAGTIWLQHRSSPHDLRARIIAGLDALRGYGADARSILFGSVEQRLFDVFSSDPDALDVRMSDDPSGLVATVALIIPKSGDVHDRAVAATRKIFQMCPEVAIAEAVTLDPDGLPHAPLGHELGHKRIPRSNMPSAAETRWNSAFFDAARRLRTPKYWSERLHAQSELASEFCRVLYEAPNFILNSHLNSARLREWKIRIVGCSTRLGDLPQLPTMLDRTSRDPARACFDKLLAALTDLAVNPVSPALLAIANLGRRVRETQHDIEDARLVGFPRFSAADDPLPEELESKCVVLSDLLLALSEDPQLLDRHRVRGKQRAEVASDAVAAARAHAIDVERATLQELFAGASVRGLSNRDPNGLFLITDDWLVTLDASAFDGDFRGPLQDPRMVQLQFRTFILFSNGSVIHPVLGFKVGSQLWPLDRVAIRSLCDRASLPVLMTPELPVVDAFLEDLMEASRLVAAATLRSSRFGRPPQEKSASEFLVDASQKLASLPASSSARAACEHLRDRVQEEVNTGTCWLAAGIMADIRTGGQNDASSAMLAATLAATESTAPS